MLTISNRKSPFRTPSRGEVVFLAVIALTLLIFTAPPGTLPLSPFDWMQQRITAQINEKPYEGDGIVVAIDEETYSYLGRSDWTRSDLARIVSAIGDAQPKVLLISRQYFSADDEAGVKELRASLRDRTFAVHWQKTLTPEELGGLSNEDLAPVRTPCRTNLVSIDPGGQGLACPSVMQFLPTSFNAPVQTWYSLRTDGEVLPSAAQVLSGASPPQSNQFDIDLSYDPDTVPSISAAKILSGDFDTEDLREKSVVVAFVENAARDTIATPGNLYTTRAAATLMAAQTLIDGRPVRIGSIPAFLFALLAALAWMFGRRPWGRWIALGAASLILASTLVLERLLIFQSTSHAILLLILLALFRIYLRGRDAIQIYRGAASSKSRFLAQASHDLRQPIHAIGLLAERLAQTDLSPDQAELVSKITWSVDNTSRMFRSLLDTAAIESGNLQIRIGDVSINELLADLDNQNALAAEQAGVDLCLVPSDLVLKTDRALLGTMLQNLVSNAIRHSPGKRVLVGCRRRGKRVAIMVVDNGRGISQSDLKHVESEFYRGSGSSFLRSDNKGLGLAIVNRLAMLLDIKFELRSQFGRGTSATIAGIEIAQSDTTRAAPSVPPANLPMSGLDVVVADDDRDTLVSTKTLLEHWGCNVAAYEHFPQGAFDCDLVLSDFDFGGGNTLAHHTAALQRLKREGSALIVITGHHGDIVRNSPEIPADIVLSKPVRPAELRSAIMALRRQKIDQ